MVTIRRDKVTLVDDDSGRELTIATTKTEEGDEIITLDNETLSKWVTGRPHGLRGGKFLEWLKVQRSWNAGHTMLFQPTQRMGRGSTRIARSSGREKHDHVACSFVKVEMKPFGNIAGCSLNVLKPKKPSDRVHVKMDAHALNYIKHKLLEESLAADSTHKRQRKWEEDIPYRCRVSWSNRKLTWRALKPSAVCEGKTICARFVAANSSHKEIELAKERATKWCNNTDANEHIDEKAAASSEGTNEDDDQR